MQWQSIPQTWTSNWQGVVIDGWETYVAQSETVFTRFDHVTPQSAVQMSVRGGITSESDAQMEWCDQTLSNSKKTVDINITPVCLADWCQGLYFSLEQLQVAAENFTKAVNAYIIVAYPMQLYPLVTFDNTHVCSTFINLLVCVCTLLAGVRKSIWPVKLYTKIPRQTISGATG